MAAGGGFAAGQTACQEVQHTCYNDHYLKAISRFVTLVYMERKCADTAGTVSVSWAGHLQCQNIIIFSKQNARKQLYQTALGNCYGSKLPKC